VFVGRRWTHLATGIPLLLSILVALLLVLGFAGLATDPTYPAKGRAASLVIGAGLLVSVAACLRIGLWRLRLGIAPPRLEAAPGGLRADAGGRCYDISWAQLHGAQIVRQGQRDLIVTWPTAEWMLRTPQVDRQTWWLPKGRHRCIWRDPGLRCDVLFDTRMLYPTTPHQVATAITLQAYRHRHR
jgi:hypothetical protein